MPELAHHERVRAPKTPEGPRGRAKTARISRQTAIAMQKRVDSFANSGLKVSGGEILRVMPADPAEHQFEHHQPPKYKEALNEIRRAPRSDEARRLIAC